MAASDRHRGGPRRSGGATLDALLDATLDSLVEDGYANTTTAPRLRARRPLPWRAPPPLPDADALRRRRGRALDERGARSWAGARRRAAPRPRPRRRGLDLLWSSYAHSLYQAALDLWSHARTDPDLRGPAGPGRARPSIARRSSRARLFPTRAGGRTSSGSLELSPATIRGLVVLDTLHPEGERARQQWSFCRARLAEVFGGRARLNYAAAAASGPAPCWFGPWLAWSVKTSRVMNPISGRIHQPLCPSSWRRRIRTAM